MQGVRKLAVQSSVSLQHLPYDKTLETALPADVTERLSFATQKLQEIVRAAKDGPTAEAGSLADALAPVGELADKLTDAVSSKRFSIRRFKFCPMRAGNPTHDLKEELFSRSLPFEKRRGLQIQTPAFPTTSIGSFPQTAGLIVFHIGVGHLSVTTMLHVILALDENASLMPLVAA